MIVPSVGTDIGRHGSLGQLVRLNGLSASEMRRIIRILVVFEDFAPNLVVGDLAVTCINSPHQDRQVIGHGHVVLLQLFLEVLRTHIATPQQLYRVTQILLLLVGKLVGSTQVHIRCAKATQRGLLEVHRPVLELVGLHVEIPKIILALLRVDSLVSK